MLTRSRFKYQATDPFTKAFKKSCAAFLFSAFQGLSYQSCNAIKETKPEFFSCYFKATAKAGDFLCWSNSVIVV